MADFTDPMDYTMDNAQPEPQVNFPQVAPRHNQCRQPQQFQQQMDFGSPSREGHRYDPVHDSTGWYQANNTSGPSRPSFAAPPSFPHWPSHPPSRWNAYENYQQTQASMPPGPDVPSYGASRPYLDMPWADVGPRGPFNPSPSFAYNGDRGLNPYSTPTTGNNTSEPGVGGNGAQPVTASMTGLEIFYAVRDSQASGANQNLTPREQAQQMLQQRAALRARSNASSSPFDPPTRPREDTNTPGNRPHPSSSIQTSMEHRLGNARAMTRNPYASRNNASTDSPRTRRPASGSTNIWVESDDEDDDLLPPTIEAYRQAELLLATGEFTGEHTLAALRGQISRGKRVPSKEALSSLEKVDVSTLKPEDRTCTICYNELAIVNPEGVTENAVRLPKCKHVFGDLCIKQWFKDSDTCPYCRDKLPSEVSIRKREGYRLYQAQREMLRAQMQLRSQQTLAPRLAYQAEDSGSGRSSLFGLLGEPDADGNRNSNSASRNLDEDEYMFSRISARDTPSEFYRGSAARTTGGDSPENRRRQQARGRIGGGRTAHTLGRPTSVGSAARWLSSPANSQPPSLHTQYPAPNNYSWHQVSTRRSITPGVNRQTGATGLSTSPENSIHSTPSPPRPRTGRNDSGPSVEASPPVVVGSGIGQRGSDFEAFMTAMADRTTLEPSSLAETSNRPSGQTFTDSITDSLWPQNGASGGRSNQPSNGGNPARWSG